MKRGFHGAVGRTAELGVVVDMERIRWARRWAAVVEAIFAVGNGRQVGKYICKSMQGQLELSRHAGVKLRGMMYGERLLLSNDGIEYEYPWVLFATSRPVRWML